MGRDAPGGGEHRRASPLRNLITGEAAIFLELVDSLRCVKPHEDSWLVARADAMDARHIIRGELGCPICASRYPVREGVVDFSANVSHPRRVRAEEGMALRAAALLGLTEPGGLVVLAGDWSAAANELLSITDGVRLLALDYAEGLESGGELSLALIDDVLPLAEGCARGIALDLAHSTGSLLAGAALALAPGGRLLAPASAPVPPLLRELARDERNWVAARSTSTVSAPVAIAPRR